MRAGLTFLPGLSPDFQAGMLICCEPLHSMKRLDNGFDLALAPLRCQEGDESKLGLVTKPVARQMHGTIRLTG